MQEEAVGMRAWLITHVCRVQLARFRVCGVQLARFRVCGVQLARLGCMLLAVDSTQTTACQPSLTVVQITRSS